LSGIFSATTGKFILHPIDTIKAKLQVLPGATSRLKSSNSVIIDLWKKIIKNEGVKGLYKGFPISVLGSAPAGMIYFTSYEFAKKNALQYETFQRNAFLVYLFSGMFAELISCILFVPVDVIKERRQVQSTLNTFKYSGDFDAIRQILKTEGVRGLYRAYGATVMSFGPFSALYFLVYENLKGFVVKNDPATYMKKVNRDEGMGEKELQIGVLSSMLCSMGAGACASLLTNPLDIAKLRLQVQRAGKTPDEFRNFYYKNMFDAMYKIARDEGALSLFNGTFARILYHVPNVAISMAVIEFSKPRVQKYFDNKLE